MTHPLKCFECPKTEVYARGLCDACYRRWRYHNIPGVYEKQKLRKRHQRRLNIQFKLAVNLRGRLGRYTNGTVKGGSAVSDLGCTLEELKRHLESQFVDGMNWTNWSRDGWHIDHIKPLSSFDLTDRDQFVKAAHFTNLRPLWAKDNLSKWAKLNSG